MSLVHKNRVISINDDTSFNSLGTTVAPIFGGWLILSEVSHATAEQVKLPYLLLSLSLLVLAVIFAFLKLPKLGRESDNEAAHQDLEDFVDLGSVWKYRHLILGAVGIFVYVGAEVAIGSFLVGFLTLDNIAGLAEKEAAHYISYYFAGAMVGRFIGAAVMQKFDAGKVLACHGLLAVVLIVIAMTGEGSLAMWAILLVGLCNSIMFPTIFSLALHGLGKYTSKGSGILCLAIVGGAIIPLLQGVMADAIGVQLALFSTYRMLLIHYLFCASWLKSINSDFKGVNMKLKNTFTLGSLMIASMGLLGCAEQEVTVKEKVKQEIWPHIETGIAEDPELEAKIAKMLAGMTLEQKIAQMIQPEIRDITVEDMRKYGFGSYLNGGGAFPNNDKHAKASDWIDLAEKMYQASIDDSLDGSKIPTMWGTDAVHGHNNVIGATLFPHNIGLGATNNPELIEKIAAATAQEVMVTGIDWVFAPTVAVVRDDRWGRTYEGYSEDPEIVKAYSAAIVKGLQGAVDKDFLSDKRVISTVKHFLGDGGTEGGDDQGNNTASEQELFEIHAQGYVGGLGAGAQTVMASFNSWNGEKIHGSKYLLTDVLKGKMGFDGFVVGDWNGHGQIPGCNNADCAQAANAGLDVYMVPTDAWKPLYENLIKQVNNGEIAQSRIDDAVTRILRVKMRAGLFDKPSPAKRPLSGKTEIIGSAEHRAVAKQAVRESLVLLKNKQQLLPLSPKANVLVAGLGADNIGMQSGGWTITWQGTGNENSDFPGGTSIFDGIKKTVEQAGGQVQYDLNGEFETKPDVAIVVFGEQPYAEGNGDLDNLEYQRGNKTDSSPT